MRPGVRDGVYGHRGFVVVIGATEEHAGDLLDSKKSELEHNDLLLADFPEVCYPIRALEGIYQRANGQLFEGRNTDIGWTAKELVLPTIPGSPASGAVIRVAGITGHLRGMKYKRPDGTTVRPSLVLVDDPQTDESARSPSQCMERERVLGGAVLGLGGPGVEIAGLMTITVVRPDDMADGILDREKHPEWQVVPAWCEHLTAFIDVQEKMLFYAVVGWSHDFSGAIVDYGTEPDQKDPLFTLRASRRTLKSKHRAKSLGLEGLLYKGLEDLVGRLCGGEWKRDDGAPMRVERCLIDANWGQSTPTVYLLCRQSSLAALLYPSHGRYVGASSRPFSEYQRKRGDRVGLNWRIPSTRDRQPVRHVLFDTNYWKSFVHERFGVGMGDPGCLSLFGRDAREHRLLAEHMTAEAPVRTEGRGRTVDEWKLRQPGLDNHWLDCVVGAAVAASIQGAELFGAKGPKRRERRKISLAEIQRRRG